MIMVIECKISTDMFAPPVNHAMRVLDRSFFSKTIPLAAALVLDNTQIHATRQQLKQDILDVGKVHSVVEDPSSSYKALLLGPRISAQDKNTWSDILNQLVLQKKVTIIPYELKLSYPNWTYCKVRLTISFMNEVWLMRRQWTF